MVKKSRFTVIPITLFVTSALWISGSAAQAQVTIPSASDAGPVSQGAGPGLNGLYYGEPFQETNADVEAYISSHSPVATFISSQIAYPSAGVSTSDSGTLASFLGSDAASLSVPSVGTNNLNGQLISFTGYVAVNTPGTYDFELGTDDGGFLDIGGALVVDNGNTHAFQTVSNIAVFSQAGLYPLLVDYYEDNGVTGVTLSSSLTGINNTVIPQSLLFRGLSSSATPEPGAYAMFASLGLTGAALLRRRRAR